MYKKAGVVIAIILVVIAVVIGVFGSCGGNGGVRVATVGSGALNSGDGEIIGGSEKGSDGAENGSNSDVVVSSQISVNNSNSEVTSVIEQSVASEVTSIIEQEHQDSEITSVIEQEHQDSKVNSITEQESSVSDTSNRLIEVESSEIQYDFNDREMGGKIVNKKIYLLNNTLINSFIVLAENGESYEYFVPQSAFEDTAVNTKVIITVRTYFDEGVSIVKVLSLKIDN